MQTITLKLPDEMAQSLNRRARELNRPKSEIVRKALDAELNGNKAASVLDRAGDLVGKYRGSKDSSHKRNLKGFGAWKRI